MKRILALIFAAVLMLSLTACGGEKDPDCGFEGYPANLEELCNRMQEYLDRRNGEGTYSLKIDNYPSVDETDKTIWIMNKHGKSISPRVRPMVPNHWCELENIRLMFYSGADAEYLDHFGMALIRACDVDLTYEEAQELIDSMEAIFVENSTEIIDEVVGGYRIQFQIEAEYAGGYHVNDPHVLTVTPVE